MCSANADASAALFARRFCVDNHDRGSSRSSERVGGYSARGLTNVDNNYRRSGGHPYGILVLGKPGKGERMNTETKTFALTLDMVRTIRSHPFEVVDGDTGNVLEVRLENNGLPVDLTGRYVCMVFRSCIGTALQDADSGIELGAETGTFSISLLPGSYGPGNVSADVQVYSGADRSTLITSTRFTFRCRNALLNDETMRAQATYPPLVAATREATAAAAAANAAAGQVTSAATAAQQAAADAEQAVKDAQAAVEAAVAATVEVGTVTTGAPGTEASVTNSGTANAAVLDFTIPRGDPAEAQHAAQHAAGGSDPITPAAIGAIPSAQKGAASGVATLDANSKVAAEQASAARTNVTESRTLTADDAGKFLLCYNANVTITIPAGLPIGMEVEFCRWGATTVTLAAANGVTIHSVDSMKSIGNQYGCVTLKKATADEKWLLAGDLG